MGLARAASPPGHARPKLSTMAGDRFSVEPSLRALLQDLRISPPRVLRRAGLPADLFARPPIELAPAEYFALWRGIEDEAADAASGTRNLAVEIGRAISVDLFSPALFAALCCPNLAAAAVRIAEHKPLIGPVRLEVDTRDGVTVHYRWPLEPAPPELLALTEVLFWVALARIATREAVRPKRVEVAAPPVPGQRAEIETFLRARVRTTGRYAIQFSPADARRPFLTENEQMWRALAPDLRRRLHDLDAAATVAQRVKAVLVETISGGDPSVETAATRLGTSTRTLQRQLTAEGTTFQKVLAATREALARHYLGEGVLPTEEIAFLLGYADATSFYRAFRAWSGTTPDRVRASA